MFADLFFCNCLGLFMAAGAYSTYVKEAVFMGRLHCECFPCRVTSLQAPLLRTRAMGDQLGWGWGTPGEDGRMLRAGQSWGPADGAGAVGEHDSGATCFMRPQPPSPGLWRPITNSQPVSAQTGPSKSREPFCFIYIFLCPTKKIKAERPIL